MVIRPRARRVCRDRRVVHRHTSREPLGAAQVGQTLLARESVQRIATHSVVPLGGWFLTIAGISAALYTFAIGERNFMFVVRAEALGVGSALGVRLAVLAFRSRFEEPERCCLTTRWSGP